MDSFYIALPSTASSHLYNNTQSHFRVQLPQPIELSGKWTVGLSEIHIPCTWNNIDERTDSFNIYPHGRKEAQRIKIPAINKSHFRSAKTHIEYFQSYLDLLIGQLPETIIKDVYSKVKADDHTVYATIHNSSRHNLNFSPNLGVLPYHNSSNSDIKYRFSFDKKNMNIPESWVDVIEETYKLTIPHGFYSRTEHVLEAMAEAIPEQYRSLYHLRANRNGTVTILCKQGVDLEFNNSLGEMLGFNHSFISDGKTGKYEVDLRGGVFGLYVYSNIVQPHIVGDAFAPLLRVIPVDQESTYHANYVKIYTNPDFYELMQNRFENIEIDIRSDSGERLKFTHGKTFVKLLFQKLK